MITPRVDFKTWKNKPQVILTFPSGDQVVFTRTGQATYGKDFRNYVGAKVDGRHTETRLKVHETIQESEMEQELNRMLPEYDSFRAQLHLVG